MYVAILTNPNLLLLMFIDSLFSYTYVQVWQALNCYCFASTVYTTYNKVLQHVKY